MLRSSRRDGFPLGATVERGLLGRVAVRSGFALCAAVGAELRSMRRRTSLPASRRMPYLSVLLLWLLLWWLLGTSGGGLRHHAVGIEAHGAALKSREEVQQHRPCHKIFSRQENMVSVGERHILAVDETSVDDGTVGTVVSENQTSVV